MARSKHIISNPENYINSLLSAFNSTYGDPSKYLIIALVPHPGEAPHSSLAYMLDTLIGNPDFGLPGRSIEKADPLPSETPTRKYGRALPGSGFYLHDFPGAATLIRDFKPGPGQKILLWGITWALLDFAEAYPDLLSSDTPQHLESSQKIQGAHAPGKLKNNPQSLRSASESMSDKLIVMETGGMKGRREELIREALHERLKKAFGVQAIHSEYGMTELCSQAYSDGIRGFKLPPWMKILIRDIHDPFGYLEPGRTGGINIIDLANQDSCAFIATQDLGRLNPDGTFEVLGRFDDSDLRGCALLV